MRLRIENEYDRLDAVLVHRPGPEIDRLTHENMRRYLFEDIPYLRRMQDEHDEFVEQMRSHGVQVFYLESLLLDVLRIEPARARLICDVCRTAQNPALTDDLLDSGRWSPEELAQALFAGLTTTEYDVRRTNRGSGALIEGLDEFLLPPIPNSYFCRDPAVVVREAAISSKMHYVQRVRETQIVRAVLENHPEFLGNSITYGGSDEPTEDRPYTIEGGDVIVLSPDSVLIGASERTRSETIKRLAGKCLRNGQVRRVYEVPIPTERTFMHLDTVFTVLDRGVVLWYAPVMANLGHIHRFEPDDSKGGSGVRRVDERRTFLDILGAEFGGDVTVIETAGGSSHYGPREQRMDGTNALALAPRVAVLYDRNEHTRRALTEHGITCLSIAGSELVRGLGGPRCMTMPLGRSSKKPGRSEA